MTKDFLSLAEWCEKVGVSLNTYYRLAADDRPAVIRLGRRVLVSQESHTDWCSRMAGKSQRRGRVA